jgi:hypothetical protein
MLNPTRHAAAKRELFSSYITSPEAAMLQDAGKIESAYPRIIGISMIKNESDIIEVFVRHNLQFLDALVILDNGSTDGTGEILNELIHQGLPLVRLFAPRIAFNQDERMTNLMRAVSMLFLPAAIAALDADEFIVCSGRELFRLRVLSLPDNTIGLLPFISYVPQRHNHDVQERNILRRIIHRRKCEDYQWHKIVIPKKLHSNPHSQIQMGNHEIISSERVADHAFTDVSLAHFPVRSSNQIQKKLIVNWLTVLAMGNRSGGTAGHWKQYYDQFKANDYAEVDITHIANHYSASVPSDLIPDPVKTVEMCLDITARLSTDSLLRPVVEVAEELIKHQHAAETLMRQEPVRWSANPAYALACDGGWSPPTPPLNVAVDYPPFDYLSNLLRPQSVLEICPAHGCYLNRFREMGAKRVVGACPDDSRIVFPQGIEIMPYAVEKPLVLHETFDLVICAEACKILPRGALRGLIDSAVVHADGIIVFPSFSANQPGRKGLESVLVKDLVQEFHSRGWMPLAFQTLAFRLCATISAFRATPVLFIRENKGKELLTESFDARDLELQEKILWNWTDQAPGYYMHPHLGDELTKTWRLRHGQSRREIQRPVS